VLISGRVEEVPNRGVPKNKNVICALTFGLAAGLGVLHIRNILYGEPTTAGGFDWCDRLDLSLYPTSKRAKVGA
jgi:hypothetical protein